MTTGYCDPRIARTKEPTPHDIIWAAGIFEGEGSCKGYNRGRGTYVSVPQKDTWLLEQLKTLFGGSIGPHNKGKHVNWQWQITGARARGFLMSIYAMLSPRRQKQVRAALGA